MKKFSFPWFEICNRCPAVMITAKGYECSKIKVKSRKGHKKLMTERNYKTGEMFLKRPGKYFTEGKCIRNEVEKCRCSETELVEVLIADDLSCTGKGGMKKSKIDKCIAPLVKELQAWGVNMRSSCCGHGETFGHVVFADGNEIKLRKRIAREPGRKVEAI